MSTWRCIILILVRRAFVLVREVASALFFVLVREVASALFLTVAERLFTDWVWNGQEMMLSNDSTLRVRLFV